MAAKNCPGWCVASHGDDGEHVSAGARLGDLLLEVLQYPGDEQVYLSLLEVDEGGRYFTIPMTVVPSIATTALRLIARADPHGD